MSRKVNFTKAIIEAVVASKPEPGKRLVLIDGKTPGLQCRITHSGVATFSVYRRIKGGRIERITLGSFPSMTIERARAVAATVNACIENGGNPGEVKRAHKEEPTFKEFFDDYIERYSKPYKRTWKADIDNYRLYLHTPLGNKKLSQIINQDIASIHTKISKQIRKTKDKDAEPQYKLTTANRILALLSSVFSWGLKNRLCKENPALGIDKNPNRERHRFLLPEELSSFFDAVNKETNITMRDYIMLALFTGVRKCNLTRMRWDQISFQQKVWFIPRTKNEEPLVMPLMDEVIAILKQRFNNGSEYVFPGDGKNGHLVEPRYGLSRVLKTSGIKDFRLHDLRRTFGSWQAIKGSSAIIIGKSLGHKSIEATKIYARLNLDPVRQSLEVSTRAMLAAAEAKNDQNEASVISH